MSKHELSPEELEECMEDVRLNRPGRIKTPEAAAFRLRHKKRLEEVAKKGGYNSVTMEMPLLD